MSSDVCASPGSVAGQLLQKAVSLTLVLGLAAMSSGGTVETAAWGCADAFVEQGDVGVVDLQSSSTSIAAVDPAIGLARTSEELAIVKRILATVRTDADAHTAEYLDRLDEIFDFADTNREQLERIAPALAGMLQAARVNLLDAAPTARRWTMLARAVDPHASLRTPPRFIRPPVARSIAVDPDQVEAAVWARAVAARV